MTINLYDGVTLTVEVGFASNPSTAIGSTTWTDISAYVRSVNSNRGRGSELEQFRAGQLELLVDNRDRRFDPNYTSSPYSPNVLPMRRVRVRATYSAVTYDVWSGFVDDWPQQYVYPAEASVPLRATDGFKVLALTPLAESVHYYDVTSLGATAWWRLGESSGTIAANSISGSYTGTYAGGATFNSTSGLLVGSSDGAISFDGVDDRVTAASPVTAFPVSIEMWFQTTTAASSIYMNVPVGTYEVYFEARTDGKIRANIQSNGAGDGIVYFTGSATTVNDGNIHHVVATYAASGASPTLYVDGVAESAIASSQSVADDSNTLVTIGAKSPTFGIVSATIDEVAVYPSTLSAGNVSTLYGGGHNPWESDGTGARIGRLLDKASWPSADRTVATGISTLQSADLGAQNALSLIQNVEASEQGQFYIAGNGQAIFRDRHWRFENSTAITSQGTFGDGAGELDYFDIVTDGGETFMANHVRASRNGGATVDVTDATSITSFFERLDSSATGLDNQSDSEIRDLANWRLATRKNPIPRVTMLEIHPRRDPTNLYPKVLGLDIGHRVTVKRRPQNVGSALTYTVLIEGVSHTIPFKGDWVTRLYLSSSDSNAAVQPLILDDTTYGILDTNVLGY